ncbi:predicted protein [Sclerotinia sclerotiorum 1980 UF-70]|uniref:Uncharacterized protein n=1 Tax=Sclerotinia sclerotiorum (strain ATCC 18683 / 1980 / Ss-1) TaxID=665079 RepID=A7F5U2_SCLS1|nr:predicted protein [Sclerotinia sclerotiorum 1980 UF-70]EDN98113.1 predicted protein [Sclerotinia sclerotiorum 1980 UF-70]
MCYCPNGLRVVAVFNLIPLSCNIAAVHKMLLVPIVSNDAWLDRNSALMSFSSRWRDRAMDRKKYAGTDTKTSAATG